jgi:hypothetical protein
VLVYTWLVPRRMKYGYFFWPDSSMCQARDSLVIVLPQQHGLSLSGVALVTSSPTSGVRVVSVIGSPLPMAVVAHTHTFNRYAPAVPGIFEDAQELPSQHPLRLELGAQTAVYGYVRP